MQQGRTHHPQRHTEPVTGQQPDAGIGGERERAGQEEDLEGAADDEAGSHHRSPKVIRATHLVLRTPGAAGTITRAG
ncbi:hypothetical protein GCM10011578_070830 [Streptomyces fuscichromogenes]|uniref:Uncharacterized protein n=1 Tax=Streptomyces fuscichromogenes TaxID=1324013 RepID=A0A917XJ61_9ACTN|nr:hypothetical protein GCM10011578_070830 [Streptomyces fuscichromogenes]